MFFTNQIYFFKKIRKILEYFCYFSKLHDLWPAECTIVSHIL